MRDRAEYLLEDVGEGCKCGHKRTMQKGVCGTAHFRFALWEIADPSKPTLLFILLNPGAPKGPGVVSRCRAILSAPSRRDQFGGFEIVNLTPVISSNSADILDFDFVCKTLATQREPIAERLEGVRRCNVSHIEQAVKRCGKIVVGWGWAGIFVQDGIENVRRATQNKELWSLGTLSSGEPTHPQRLKAPFRISKYAWPDIDFSEKR